MKKLLVAGALLFSVFTTAVAQNRQMPTPEERAKRLTETLAHRLTLTDDQKVKVHALFLDQAKTTDSLRTASQGDFQGMRSKIQPVQEATDKKVEALLNDDQKKQFQAYQDERKSRMQGRRPANN